MTGTLAGIARHGQPKGPMETLSTVTVTAAEGLHGDFRGALAATKPGRRRQVSLLEADSWAAAQADVGAQVDWWQARRNLLIAGVRIPREVGARVAIGEALVIEITGECDPCDRMDALHAGLRAGMTPDWRGGFCGRVIADGEIAVGDEVRILR